MSKLFRWSGKQMLVAAICTYCCVMTGCVESSFELARESRLPKWITLPPGLTREDVSVTMDYHIDRQGRSATFIAKDKNGRILSKVNGKQRGLHPVHLNTGPQRVEHGAQYPAYEVITVNGITEIIEHKKAEPRFYVSDDPAARKELLGE